MGGDKHRNPDLLKTQEEVHDFFREFRVEVTGGLIRQQQLRFVDHRAGDTDTLLLTPGKFDGIAFFIAQQADRVESGTHPARHLRRRITGNQ